KKECCKSVFRTCFVCCPCNSFTLIPVIYDKYAGKIGRTQGERNDNAPAPNAKIIPTNKNVSVLISAISYILSTLIIPNFSFLYINLSLIISFHINENANKEKC